MKAFGGRGILAGLLLDEASWASSDAGLGVEDDGVVGIEASKVCGIKMGI
jgi:hypothetical protein